MNIPIIGHDGRRVPDGERLGPALKRVTVIGTGLIGTSIALAMRRAGAEVLLIDRDPAVAGLAAELGAGAPWNGESADVAVLAVPPSAVARTLLDAQERGLAAAYTDVASVKVPPLAEAARLGCDLRVFVGGQPLGGSERSGPLAARPELFDGRPWALCPAEGADPAAVEAVTSLVTGCGATPVRIDAAGHDRTMALVSHAPHVVSSAMAARFADAPEGMVGLAGQGARDVTRIARRCAGALAGDPGGQCRPVADVIEAVSDDLARVASALRARAGGEPAVAGLLARGVTGRDRIPVKRGGSAGRLTTVTVLVADRPGELALILQAAGVAGINIEDVSIEHLQGRPVGVAELSVAPESAPRLIAELRDRGWSLPDPPGQ
ncbi:prephenate dehydrogenase [Actinomadura madurae]|uniref:prephenate dehydrogenase n=1 Tax=Actinomadura madurae TaxID=1993 RepID=UPI0027E3460C|nr:prephenate dehydrogenase [Actinomadura madurae]MCP9955331.1 prephenate dehydrogenase [Actinomadura madurae]